MAFKIPALQFVEPMSVEDWATKYFYLPEMAQMYSFAACPFFRRPSEFMLDISETSRVIIQVPSQCGKSTLLMAYLGTVCHNRQEGPTLFVMDTALNAERFSSTRLIPFFRDTCKLLAFSGSSVEMRGVSKSKSVKHISLDNGSSFIVGGSNSPSTLSSMPVQITIGDEVARFAEDIRGEGSSLGLLFARSLRFRNSMTILTSTPTTEQSLFNKHFESGTCEIWSARCAACGAFMPVNYDDIDFTTTPPVYACPNCGSCYTESEVRDLECDYASPKNQRPVTDRFKRVVRSFGVQATLIPAFYSWESLKADEIEAAALGEASLRTWRNTKLGLPFIPSNEVKIDTDFIISHACDDYDLTRIPDWCTFIVGGIDTQDYGFAVQFAAVDTDCIRTAVLSYTFLRGDLRRETIWNDLKNYLNSFEGVTIDGRRLRPLLVAVDCGGHYYDDVLALCSSAPRLLAIRGYSQRKERPESERVIERVSLVDLRHARAGQKTRVPLTFINTAFTKDLIFSAARAYQSGRKPDLYFPAAASNGIDADYFDGVYKSERRVDYANGAYYYSYLGTYRNEPLDTLCYLLAAREAVKQKFGVIPSVSPTSQEEIKIEGLGLGNRAAMAEAREMLKTERNESQADAAPAPSPVVETAKRKKISKRFKPL